MTIQLKPTISFNLTFSQSKSKLRSSIIMKSTTKDSNFATTTTTTTMVKRKLPILLFDVMDTIVRDPFYQDIPNFFGMPMKELLECKHPTSWNEFEKGLIKEDELAKRFFKDGRHFDLEGLKTCMTKGYSYIDGVENLLSALKNNNYEMHAFTNYPIWYQMIEEKLKLSNYLSWTFCSCTLGFQKPDPEFYREVVKILNVEPGSCIFIDDRMKNVEGAVNEGMVGIQFKDANLLHQELIRHGVNVSSSELTANQ